MTGELTGSEKARVYSRYDNGEISEERARELLGDYDFEDAVRMTEGTESLLSEEPEEFVK